MKATSFLGGVEVFQIIIQVIRSKFVAVLLGPTGMGIVGLLSSTISLITGFTAFGIRTSAIKNIAEAHGTGNETRISTVITVLPVRLRPNSESDVSQGFLVVNNV